MPSQSLTLCVASVMSSLLRVEIKVFYLFCPCVYHEDSYPRWAGMSCAPSWRGQRKIRIPLAFKMSLFVSAPPFRCWSAAGNANRCPWGSHMLHPPRCSAHICVSSSVPQVGAAEGLGHLLSWESCSSTRLHHLCHHHHHHHRRSFWQLLKGQSPQCLTTHSP